MANGDAPRRVAAFDFDGTLIPGDSVLRFVLKVSGPRRFANGVVRSAIVALRTRGDRDAAKAALLSGAMAGLEATAVTVAGADYADHLLGRLRSDGTARIRWHQTRGHEVVLVSASLTAYLAPLARRLGIDAVLATRLEVDTTSGRLTGRLSGPNVRGPEKVVRLQQWLDGADTELWAYGDSSGDNELLARADHGTRIRSGRWPDLPA